MYSNLIKNFGDSLAQAEYGTSHFHFYNLIILIKT